EVARFLREAGALRQLRHRHLVAYHDSGESGGVLYFAMEYVEGTDAARLLKRSGPLGVRLAVRVTCQVLRALEYAHPRGFVHREIKPSNILLGKDDGHRIAKLSDFGLARIY